jgi:hypothetical protein
MKKVILMTAFMALATASQGFAANDMSYDKDTSVTASADTSAAPMTTRVHHKKLHRSKTSARATARHPNAGAMPLRSSNVNDGATSRKGMPAGETNGPINGQSDDQNYGQPTNH